MKPIKAWLIKHCDGTHSVSVGAPPTFPVETIELCVCIPEAEHRALTEVSKAATELDSAYYSPGSTLRVPINLMDAIHKPLARLERAKKGKRR